MVQDTMIELATGRTKESDTTGSATSSTALEPTIWFKGIVDAAQKRLMFMQVAKVVRLQQGQKDIVIPYRSTYLGSSGVTYTTTTPNAGTGLTATKIDNLDGVTLTPTMQDSRISIGNYAFRTNAVNLIDAARDELIYSISDKYDAAIASKLGDATSTSSSATGMQVLYGGDATSDNTLSTGDVITTDLVAEARKLLMSVNKQYRASGTATAGGGYGALSGTVAGNPWMPSPDEPFVLFIGPSQEEAFLKDSQFINAAEYGNNEIVLNGEIGKYIGIKIITTNNVEQVASGVEGPDAETATAGANMTRCLLVKSQRCVGFAWGQEPVITPFNNVPEVSQDIVLESAYDIEIIHSDAIVAIDVTDA